MKKIMIVLSAIVLTCGLNAATFDWKLKITGATSGDAYNTLYHVYLVNSSTWDGLGTKGQTYTALMNNKLDTASFTAVSGKSSKTYDMDTHSISDSTKSKGSTLGVYYMLVEDVDGTPETYIAVSDTLTGRDGTDAAQLGSNWEIAKSSLPAEKSFYTEESPEPTSGILVLLGMSGLLLRRRRS